MVTVNNFSLNHTWDLAGNMKSSTNGITDPAVTLNYGYDGTKRVDMIPISPDFC